MHARYRYRIEPTGAQRSMLARTFGCALVVFNDVIRARDEAWEAGTALSKTEVQRLVITEAKRTEARVWLSEVASVALVQSVADAHKAYQNFFDSCTGKRKGRRVGKPRLKSRRQKGSANRAKTRRKVAVAHGEVSRARRDYHHKQALDLVRENQALHVEDLNVAGMVRNRKLARAISEAGWGQFVRILEEKAEYYGRTVHTVSRWLPSSKTCSSCGVVQDAMSLHVRTFDCPGCGLVLDRDFNAACNTLAAGRAERENACGARVSPPSQEGALGNEAGSRGKPRGTTTPVAA